MRRGPDLHVRPPFASRLRQPMWQDRRNEAPGPPRPPPAHGLDRPAGHAPGHLGLEGVTIVDLYAEYPSLDIDVAREQQRLLAHDVIVLQHPFYWYSSPAIIKEWQDLVLENGWAYGPGGTRLAGRYLMSAISTGGSAGSLPPRGPQPLRDHGTAEPLQPDGLSLLHGLSRTLRHPLRPPHAGGGPLVRRRILPGPDRGPARWQDRPAVSVLAPGFTLPPAFSGEVR